MGQLRGSHCFSEGTETVARLRSLSEANSSRDTPPSSLGYDLNDILALDRIAIEGLAGEG